MKSRHQNTTARTFARVFAHLTVTAALGLGGLGITVVNHAFGTTLRLPRSVGRGARGGVMAERKGERKAFLLRVDPKVLDAVQRWADDDLRSLNGQIEYLLRRLLHDNGRLKTESPTKEKAEDE